MDVIVINVKDILVKAKLEKIVEFNLFSFLYFDRNKLLVLLYFFFKNIDINKDL